MKLAIDKDSNPHANTNITNTGVYIGSLKMNLGRDFNRMVYKDIVDWEINSVCLSNILDQVYIFV